MGRALLVAAVAAGLKVVARLYREKLPYQTGNTGLWSLPHTPGHSSSQGRKSSAATTHWVLCPPNPLSCSLSIKEACLGAVCLRCIYTVCLCCMHVLCTCMSHMHRLCVCSACCVCTVYVVCGCTMHMYVLYGCTMYVLYS